MRYRLAVLGITNQAYIVFAANAFALLGPTGVFTGYQAGPGWDTMAAVLWGARSREYVSSTPAYLKVDITGNTLWS
jgi:hypothetical protein